MGKKRAAKKAAAKTVDLLKDAFKYKVGPATLPKPGSGMHNTAAGANYFKPILDPADAPTFSMPRPFASSSAMRQAGKVPGASVAYPSQKSPSILSNNDLTQNMLAMGTGAMLGGGASWLTGGGFFQGAMAGAIVGGGLGFGAGPARQALTDYGKGNKYAQNVVEMSQFLTSTDARRAMMMGGGLLGGFAFGGNKSHKRGFNKHRGNSIGR